MNVTVITWMGAGNHGTCLQAYALCQKLTSLGYHVRFVSYFDRLFGFKSLLKGVFSIIGIMQIRRKKKLQKTESLKKLYEFQKEKMNIYHIYFPKQYKWLLEQTDVFVTGSDQIWNAWNSFNTFYFLDFAKDKKRIAYASSIGTSDFPEQYKDKIKILLSFFSHISVREETGVKAISKLLHRNDIIQVLDPTFLLEPHEWKTLAQKAIIEIDVPSRYMLCYLIGNNPHYVKQVISVQKQYKIENIIIIPAIENKSFYVPGATIYTAAGPKEFIYLIQQAALVCTDSFHATALSINLSVDFVEFLRFNDTDEKSQNSRIYDVLEHYKLSSRLYSPETDEWTKRITYAPVQIQLTEDRIKSTDFLINSIEH